MSLAHKPVLYSHFPISLQEQGKMPGGKSSCCLCLLGQSYKVNNCKRTGRCGGVALYDAHLVSQRDKPSGHCSGGLRVLVRESVTLPLPQLRENATTHPEWSNPRLRPAVPSWLSVAQGTAPSSCCPSPGPMMLLVSVALLLMHLMLPCPDAAVSCPDATLCSLCDLEY